MDYHGEPSPTSTINHPRWAGRIAAWRPPKRPDEAPEAPEAPRKRGTMLSGEIIQVSREVCLWKAMRGGAPHPKNPSSKNSRLKTSSDISPIQRNIVNYYGLLFTNCFRDLELGHHLVVT